MLPGARLLKRALTGSRLFCTDKTGSNTALLLRDYIQRSLYDPEEGYFTSGRADIPVGTVGKPLEFNNFSGQEDYLTAVKNHYTTLQTSWLTPSEIFTPFYGKAVANFILDKRSQAADPREPLRIFEIGGGTGTLARDILSHLRAAVPETYSKTEYVCIEISPQLAELQETTVISAAGHHERFRVECRDAADAAGWESSAGNEPCFILLMEVLDNCPHDRLHRESVSAPWMQTAILEQTAASGQGRSVSEVLQPLSDELIQRCLSVGPWEYNGKPLWHRLLDYAVDAGSQGADNTVFLPTKCMQLLETLSAARPNHCILAADFDELPGTTIPGKNAPLVATTADGETLDHCSYLVPPGTADIFFPTDFQMLERMYTQVARTSSGIRGSAANVLKSTAFMRQYASIAETTTLSGYNPLLQDFSNTSFFWGLCN